MSEFLEKMQLRWAIEADERKRNKEAKRRQLVADDKVKFDPEQCDGCADAKNQRLAVCRLCNAAAPAKPKPKNKVADRRKRGTTRKIREAMVTEYENRCGLCQTEEEELVIDHDHRTNAIRGLVCGPCNQRLRTIDTNYELTRRIVEYLSAYRLKDMECEEAFKYLESLGVSTEVIMAACRITRAGISLWKKRASIPKWQIERLIQHIRNNWANAPIPH